MASPQPLHRQYAAGLRQLARFVEDHPEFADWFSFELSTAGIGAHPRGEDKAAAMGSFARAALRAGAKVDKDYSDTIAKVIASFGEVKVSAYEYRDEVCELVVLDEEETVEINDPDYVEPEPPKVTVTRKKTQWRCRPLLASDPAATKNADGLSLAPDPQSGRNRE